MKRRGWNGNEAPREERQAPLVEEMTPAPIHWRGWLIHSTNWHVPLYAAGEMPPGHVGWTTKEHEALGFQKKAHAQAFMDNIPNHGGIEYALRFHPWRAEKADR